MYLCQKYEFIIDNLCSPALVGLYIIDSCKMPPTLTGFGVP